MGMELSVAGEAKIRISPFKCATVAHPTDSVAGNPFKFAQSPRDVSSTFRSQDVELITTNRVGMMLYAQGEV
jgi:hypothetical protein